MAKQAVGLLETRGLCCLVSGIDAALKAANVELTGPMKNVGSGLCNAVVTGDVAAVKAAIDAGADDFETYDGTLHIYSEPHNLEEIRTTLTSSEAAVSSTELSMIPSNTVMLDSRKAIQTLRLLETLEDLDDVQKVYSNADFPEDALQDFKGD